MLRFIIATAFIAALASCSNKPKNELTVFKYMYIGFEQSNQTISNATQVIYLSSEQRLLEPASSEIAKRIQPRIAAIRKLTSEIITYLHSLKDNLKEEAGTTNLKNNEAFHEDNVGAVNRMFNTNKKGEELFQKLEKYRKEIMADSTIFHVFNNNTIIIAKDFDIDKRNPKDFVKECFYDLPAIAAMGMLTKFENNVRIIENNTVNYWFSSIAVDVLIIDDFPQPLIALSTTKAQPGEVIEISAGIGTFSAATQTEVTINNKKIWVDNGVANYKLKSSTIPGEHQVPVTISYKNPEGKKQIIQKTIVYTVAQ